MQDDYLFQDRNSTKAALSKLMKWNEENGGAERGKKLQQIMKDAVCAIETEKDNDALKSKKLHLFTEYLNQMDVLLREWRNCNEEELA